MQSLAPNHVGRSVAGARLVSARAAACAVSLWLALRSDASPALPEARRRAPLSERISESRTLRALFNRTLLLPLLFASRQQTQHAAAYSFELLKKKRRASLRIRAESSRACSASSASHASAVPAAACGAFRERRSWRLTTAARPGTVAPVAVCRTARWRPLVSSEMEASARTTVIVDNEMRVQVQGEEITPEEYHNEAGWTLAGEAYVEAAPAGPRQGMPDGSGGSQASPKSKFNKNVRASVIKAARMPAMPLEESKIVVRPRGGLDIVKTWHHHRRHGHTPPRQDPRARKARRTPSAPTRNRILWSSVHRTKTTQQELDRNIVNERNPLAVGAKRIGSTTSAIVVFQGPKIDVCHQCGRVGHRKDVCPTPTIKTCLACGLANPKEDHSCTPKCKLCGGEHSTGDRTCKAKYKMPYVVRKRQWVRRQAELQLLPESDFPPLDKPSAVQKSRTPSKNRAPKSRDSSKKRSPSHERVGWVDAAKGNNTRSGRRKSRKPRRRRYEQGARSHETLRQENAALRTTINNLSREIAEIRKLLLCNNESPQRPTPSSREDRGNKHEEPGGSRRGTGTEEASHRGPAQAKRKRPQREPRSQIRSEIQPNSKSYSRRTSQQ
ncbi:hypothetical protein HPB52_024988 [Rhipicephalus sanguineus]|uniref:CCHC-type domain-containing protein n=1 Tax=Rhipicephalus sanguineus TaxID=34632 RepID=A0A9D4TDM7_RHISA|nr:hypothetical protein HPB52_024988 [Rhipicephalus sanguineus]